MSKRILLLGLACLVIPRDGAEAAMVRANFHLYGQTYRQFLAADTKLEVEVRYNSTTLAEGRMRYNVGIDPSTGVLSDVVWPALNTFGVIDKEFSVDFEIDPGDVGNLEVFLRAGGVRAVWNFTDDPAAILPGGTLDPRNGLSLTGITLADGRALAEEGLAFEFSPENTRLNAGGSVNAAFTNASDTLENASYVEARSYPLFASTQMTGNLFKLEVNPDPNPFVIDGATASITSANPSLGNFRLVETSTVVPEPTTLTLLGLGTIGMLAASRRRRKSSERAA